MAYNLYSRRNLSLPDVFIYDPISERFRQQMKYIIQDFIEENDLKGRYETEYYSFIHKVLTREYGVPYLFERKRDPEDELFAVLLYSVDSDKVIDLVEWFIKSMLTMPSVVDFDHKLKGSSGLVVVNKLVDEINFRFKENGLGYRYEAKGKIIIKAENELLHQEIIQPVIHYLSDVKFKNANDEFLKAHEHFRHGRNKECLNDCLKAFESTLKIICSKKGWAFDPKKDTAQALIKIVYDNGLIPSYIQTKLSGLRSTLEGGVPTIRNRNSGHGQGTTTVTVDDSLASYCINLTGSTIKFLLELS